MNDELFIDELQKKGLIDEAGAKRLKKEILLSGRGVEDVIHERRIIDDEKICAFKSELFGVPYQKVDFNSWDPELIKIIPEETIRTYGVIPISKQDSLFVVGMLHPNDLKAQEALKFIARRNRLDLGIYLISYGDWQDVLRRYSPFKSEIQSAVKSLNLKTDQNRKVVQLESSSSGNEDAPVIRIVADTLKEAVQSKASDVHIEPQETYLRIRFRIDGELQEAASLPLELSGSVVSRVKVMSNLKIDETRIPQDGRFRSRIFDRDIDFRISTFPTPLGEKVAIRILDQTTGLKDFSALGLTGLNLEKLKVSLEKPFGMILVNGPTGSGKSTTLYALLSSLNKEGVNIVSLEDPVEYFISGVNQSQMRPEIGYDFASGLRQILRQDPDVIMVGEIRDSETAGLAVHAALTGHVVLSTIHTNNSIGVIPRLIDMKVDPFLLPSALNIMVGQRLVSLICQKCKKPEEASASVAKIIHESLATLPDSISSKYHEPFQIYHSEGCDECKGKGVVGRIAIFEILEMTKNLAEIVNSGPTGEKILGEAREQGMVNMRADGVLKALDGLVSIEDVIRETTEV
jgi:type IV pilus assembly protein PilB